MKVLFFLFALVLLSEQTTPYPYLVRICRPNIEERCNGVLIKKNIVLTVAHCLHNIDSVGISFGFHELACPVADALVATQHDQKVNNTTFTIHSGFSTTNQNFSFNDVAIIKLPTPVNFTKNLQSANITKTALKNYRDHKLFVQGQIVKDKSDNFTIKLENDCVFVFSASIKGGHFGCGRLDHEGLVDQNGFPLEVDGKLVGLTTTWSNDKFKSDALFVDLHFYAEWIRQNGAKNFGPISAIVALVLIVNVLLKINT